MKNLRWFKVRIVSLLAMAITFTAEAGLISALVKASKKLDVPDANLY